MKLTLKRVYDLNKTKESYRVLVDKLWPRGVSKEDLKLDYWPKDLCPSDDLRKWFHEDKDRWKEFCKKYRNELSDKKSEINDFYNKVENEEKVSLLYATKYEEHNHAKVLKDVLENHSSKK